MKKQHNKGPKFGRSYKNFNDDEFGNELKVINWDRLFEERNIDEQVSIFLGKINGLLDEMAPVRRLTKKEINLKQNPWITRGILKSMRNRDKLYREFVKERDITKKQKIIQLTKFYATKLLHLSVEVEIAIMLPISKSIKPMLRKLGKGYVKSLMCPKRTELCQKS